MKVSIQGLNKQEKREFNIVEKEVLEEELMNISSEEIFINTMKLAEQYRFGGEAYAYLDAETGNIEYGWMQQNQYLHPFDSYKEIILCKIETPIESFDERDLLDERELDDYYEETDGYISPDQYIEEHWGIEELEDRIENVREAYAWTFSIDWEEVRRQVDELYENVVH